MVCNRQHRVKFDAVEPHLAKTRGAWTDDMPASAIHSLSGPPRRAPGWDSHCLPQPFAPRPYMSGQGMYERCISYITGE